MRVLVTGGTGFVGSHTVALRSDAFPDDGISPLAVVLSAETGGGAMNFIDAHVTLDAWRSLARALGPASAGRVIPNC